MTDTPEETKLKRITIKTEVGTKWFDDPQKLVTWLQKQRQLYTFHQKNSNKYQLQNFFSQMDQTWNGLINIVSNSIVRSSHQPEQYNSQVDNFTKSFITALNANKIFTEEAQFYPFLQGQIERSDVHAMATVAVALKQNIAHLDSDMLNALGEANVYFSGNAEFEKDVDFSFSQIRDRWEGELSSHQKQWEAEYKKKLIDLIDNNQKSEALIKRWEEQTEKESQDLEDSKNEFKERFTLALQSSREDLENLTATYDDKLALQASVAYWKIQHKSHVKKAKGFAIALGVTIVVVLTTIILFSIFGLDKSIKEIAVSRLVTAAAITSFGVWGIKILANIFMSHLHLATDAQERRTMMHTYLALTRKGHGPKEEDRQLILQTLFRPSTTDMVKNDQGPTQLVDLVNRLSPKQ